MSPALVVVAALMLLGSALIFSAVFETSVEEGLSRPRALLLAVLVSALAWPVLALMAVVWLLVELNAWRKRDDRAEGAR